MNEIYTATESSEPVTDQSVPTDAQLLARFADRHDQSAFETLLHRHGPMVFGICRRILRQHHAAEDAFQSAFLSLAQNAGRIARPEMLASWLHSVARNAALYEKKIAVKRQRTEQELEQQMGSISDVKSDHQELWSELAPVLDREIGLLSDELRTTFILCDVEGKTRKEAAQELGWPEGTVSTRLMKARSLLAKRLTRHGVVISGVALGVLLSENVAMAAVPGTLMTSTLTAASMATVAPSTAAGTMFSKFIAMIKSSYQAVMLGKAALVGLMAITILGGGLALQLGQKKADAPPPATTLSLNDIQQGMETTFAYLRNHCVALDYRVDFEMVPASQTNQSRPPIGRNYLTWLPTQSQEQQLFLEESKGRIYSNIKSGDGLPVGNSPNGTMTVDAKTVRWHQSWSEVERWILVGDVTGFPTGGQVTIGTSGFRYGPMYDRYFKNIGYILTNPYDRAFSVEYEPTDIRFIPRCFKKAKYAVGAKLEKVDGDLCHVLEAPGIDKMWIDVAHGFLLRKRIFRWRDWRDNTVRPWIQVVNTDLEKVAEGVWLPRRSVVDSFYEGTADTNPIGERFHRETLVAKSVAVRDPMPDRQYNLEFPVGVKIFDERSGHERERISTKADNPEFDASGNLVGSATTKPESNATETPNLKLKAAVGSQSESQAVWGTHRVIEIPGPAWMTTSWVNLFLGMNFVIVLSIAGYFVVRRRSAT